MSKYVRMVDNVVQEIVESNDISASYHPDCGFINVSTFANEPNFLDIYDPETNSFMPQPPPEQILPISIPITEI